MLPIAPLQGHLLPARDLLAQAAISSRLRLPTCVLLKPKHVQKELWRPQPGVLPALSFSDVRPLESSTPQGGPSTGDGAVPSLLWPFVFLHQGPCHCPAGPCLSPGTGLQCWGGQGRAGQGSRREPSPRPQLAT